MTQSADSIAENEYRTYGVSRKDREPLLAFMLDALRKSGCTILYSSPPTRAPFRITFETPEGERKGILAYAFLANAKATKNRPPDEHRFQLKYGSDDGELHDLWRDPYGLYTTLLVGINEDVHAKRLKVAVRGAVAEEHLHRLLRANAGIRSCSRPPTHDGPDFYVDLVDGKRLTIECKNVLRQLNARGLPRLDFQRTRAAKSDPCSRYYSPQDFDVVAACLHAVSEEWKFSFAASTSLEAHRKCPGKLASNVVIDERWSSDPLAVFQFTAPRIHG